MRIGSRVNYTGILSRQNEQDLEASVFSIQGASSGGCQRRQGCPYQKRKVRSKAPRSPATVSVRSCDSVKGPQCAGPFSVGSVPFSPSLTEKKGGGGREGVEIQPYAV